MNEDIEKEFGEFCEQADKFLLEKLSVAPEKQCFFCATFLMERSIDIIYQNSKQSPLKSKDLIEQLFDHLLEQFFDGKTSNVEH